jgi:sporulation protein YlmC with PRC-barrel domain
MRFVFGAHVRTRDGHDVGKIDRLILDPDTGDLKSVAIRQGFILRHDIEIPIGAFEAGEGDELRLGVTEAAVHDFPRFVEADYTSASDDYAPTYGAPSANVLIPGGGYYEPFLNDDAAGALQASEQMAAAFSAEDLANAVIGDGNDVISSDGEKVGEVHELAFDSAGGRLTQFTLRRELFLGESVALPASLIARIDDGKITLRASVAWLDAWLSLAPDMELWAADESVLGAVVRRELDSISAASPDGARRFSVPMSALERVVENAAILKPDAARPSSDA